MAAPWDTGSTEHKHPRLSNTLSSSRAQLLSWKTGSQLGDFIYFFQIRVHLRSTCIFREKSSHLYTIPFFLE